jgi:hypothetical protein
VEIALPSDYSVAYLMDLRWKNDRLFSDETHYQYNYRYRETDQPALFGVLFTDRAIYRPGQPVYYKGILINKDKKAKKIRYSQTAKWNWNYGMQMGKLLQLKNIESMFLDLSKENSGSLKVD